MEDVLGCGEGLYGQQQYAKTNDFDASKKKRVLPEKISDKKFPPEDRARQGRQQSPCRSAGMLKLVLVTCRSQQTYREEIPDNQQSGKDPSFINGHSKDGQGIETDRQE